MRTYEGLFIFEDSLRDEALEGILDRVRGEITRLGGEIVATVPMGRKTFARPMRKRETGQYFRIVFDLAPERIAALRARYRITEEVFRVLITMGDRDAINVAVRPMEGRNDGESQ